MAAGTPTTPYDATEEEEAEEGWPFIGFPYGLYEDAATAAGTTLVGVGPFVGFPYAL
jgi:hypothetical protein